MSSLFARGGRTAWAQYTKVLEDLVRPAGRDGRVQALSVAEFAAWDTPHVNYNRHLRSTAADRLGRWAAVGSFVGGSVSGGYLEFLRCVQASVSRALPAADRSALETASRKVWRLREEARTLALEISARWRAQQRDMEAGRVALATRRQFEEQRGFPLLRAQLAQRIAAAQDAYDYLVDRLGGDVATVGRALSQCHAAAHCLALPESPEDDTDSETDTWPVVLSQTVEGDLAALRRETSRRRLTLADGVPHSAAFAAEWDGCFGIDLPFWGVSGGADGPAVGERLSERTGSVALAFENVAAFTVHRGGWFRPELLRAYGGSTPGAWGKEGYLNVIPTALLVARGVTASATLPTAEKAQVLATFDAGGAIRVGAFTFGGSSASTVLQSTCQATHEGVRLADISERALIIGLVATCPSF